MAFRTIAALFLFAIPFFAQINAQTAETEAIYNVSRSQNVFAVKLLTSTSKFADNSKNLALSPFTVWSLLAIVSEGARENTARQLESALNIPPVNNREQFRKNYRSLTKYLMQKTEGIDMEITNAIFTTTEFPLNNTFQMIAQNSYGVDVIPVDFRNNQAKAVETINSYIKKATRNRIPNFVDSSDIRDAQILVTSALYFKGQWTVPFDKDATFKDTFYDEKRNKLGDVMMMYKKGPFAYARVEFVKAHVVQLNYGPDEKMCMFVILPFIGEMLTNVLNLIGSVPLSELMDILDEAKQQYLDEDVKLYLPRFAVENDFNLNVVLDEEFGLKDVFNQDAANLLGIFPQHTYVSRIIQKAEIQVNEEGTVASSVSGGTIINKTTAPKFIANRPFAYIIADLKTKNIVFIGKFNDPSNQR